MLSACGVPTDKSPRAISNDDLPRSLRTDMTATSTIPGDGTHATTVFLIGHGKLIPSLAAVSANDLAAALATLEGGPTEAQRRDGERSALTGLDLIRDARVTGSTAIIDLDPSFADALAADQILALAQLVLTATAQTGVKQARITVKGEPIQVPRGDGSLTSSPLTAADYRSLLTR